MTMTPTSCYAALDARGRERFDLSCWELRASGYSMEYVAAVQGCTTREVEGAVRRVACGRYGDVREAMNGGGGDDAERD